MENITEKKTFKTLKKGKNYFSPDAQIAAYFSGKKKSIF